ncbi:MAG: type II toxin-antitoxin system HicA family toxin, partial [Candidatus Solibacter sp.]
MPRDVAGRRLVHVLERLGYSTIRQKGGHVRMRHEGPPAHAVTIPLNDPLKTGTLHGILSEVAQMR